MDGAPAVGRRVAVDLDLDILHGGAVQTVGGALGHRVVLLGGHGAVALSVGADLDIVVVLPSRAEPMDVDPFEMGTVGELQEDLGGLSVVGPAGAVIAVQHMVGGVGGLLTSHLQLTAHQEARLDEGVVRRMRAVLGGDPQDVLHGDLTRDGGLAVLGEDRDGGAKVTSQVGPEALRGEAADEGDGLLLIIHRQGGGDQIGVDILGDTQGQGGDHLGVPVKAHGLDLMLASRQLARLVFPLEDVVEGGPLGIQSAQRLAVDKQLHTVAVGVDLEVSGGGVAGGVVGARDVEDGLVGPMGLIDVEGILAGLVIVSHQSLGIHPGHPRLVAEVRGKIEHIPDEGTPEVVHLGDGLGPVLVAPGLILLGLVFQGKACLIIVRVLMDASARAVLREADGAVQKPVVEAAVGVVLDEVALIAAQGVLLQDALAVHDGVAAVHGALQGGGAHVGVPGQEVARQKLAGGGEGGLGGELGGVQGVDQLVEVAQEGNQNRVARGLSLVLQADDRHRGTIIHLLDKLGHLGIGDRHELAQLSVGSIKGTAAAVAVDEGDLGVDHDTVLVAELVDVGGVGVMGEADGVSPQLVDEGHILGHLTGGDGVPHVGAVLMLAHAAQGVALAVEVEARLGIHREGTEAHEALHVVQHRLAIGHLHLHRVTEGVGEAVPQVGLLYGQGGGEVEGLPRGHRDLVGGVGQHAAVTHGGWVEAEGQPLEEFLLKGRHIEAVGLLEDDAKGQLPVRIPLVDHLGGHVQLGGGGGHLGLGEEQTARSVIGQINVDGVADKEVDVAVDPAEEGEVTRQGGHGGIVGVGDLHGYGVLLAALDVVGDVKAEGGVAALVLTHGGAVDIQGGHGVGALELDPQGLARVVGGDRDGAAVDARAAVVVLAAVLTVQGVPGVGEGHRFPAVAAVVIGGSQGILPRLGQAEAPRLVEADALTGAGGHVGIQGGVQAHIRHGRLLGRIVDAVTRIGGVGLCGVCLGGIPGGRPVGVGVGGGIGRVGGCHLLSGGLRDGRLGVLAGGQGRHGHQGGQETEQQLAAGVLHGGSFLLRGERWIGGRWN